ncbi:acyl-CoA/acyl-ACP dehydrogenase [Aeromicrobium sp. YIM 150415]|uniref:acyl-CoA dehydrogenase family protein n=1 Tax=Aeromicrobium sp. YIM 150415 TaxID=2803912 RepID=UPI001964D181|nr:acyl-CoA dehydrogenase family protein [Aeromicrobium sp. YIM 150415]MBM9463567.1 acyl-CoA/acyl-ACP dehydrogenase [Aeromicrobium sp. YIM 150415]
MITRVRCVSRRDCLMASNIRGESIFTGDEELFRQTVRSFMDREIDAKIDMYESGDLPIRHLWEVGTKAGVIGSRVPQEHGGIGGTEILNFIMSWELGRSLGYGTVGTCFCTDNATNLLALGGTDELKAELFPRILTGAIQALGFTEPDAGTNSAAIRTTARRDGEDWVLRGNKMYISMGDQADVIYVVARTDPNRAMSRAGLSIFAVDGDAEGLSRGRVDMVGLPVHGLGELAFDDVRVPAYRMLGAEGEGARLLSSMMAIDRVQTAARSLGQAELALDLAIDYSKERLVEGNRPLFDFQNTKIRLAEMAVQLRAARALIKQNIDAARGDALDRTAAAAGKVFITDVSARVVDGAVQIFGAAGLADEMPISRIYASNRQFRILAGTSELLKLSVAAKL